MNSICLFSSYFNHNYIPYYIKYYVEELQKHFTELVFITNEKDLSDNDREYLKQRNIQLKMVANEGFDFGMWYKALNEIQVSNYDRIGFINDSSILFKPLDNVFNWVNTCDFDYCGLASSNRITYHIQSYFVIANKKAIAPVADYFKKNGLINDYKQVIKTYEVGLSKYLQEHDLKIGAMYHSKKNIGMHNPSFFIIEELIKEGLPMIKKKIIFRSYRKGEYLTLLRMKFNVDHRHYINLIIEQNKSEKVIDFEMVANDFQKKNLNDIYLYKIVLFFYKLASKSKFLTYLFHQLVFIRRRLKGNKNRQSITTSETEIN